MKQFIVNIPENKEALFLGYLKSMNIADFTENEIETSIPDFQKTIVRERIKKYHSSTDQYFTRADLDKKIKMPS
jgi:hypothetical protein